MSEFKNVIWINGMPRSGTTWLSQVFASSPSVRLKFCPLFSYEFKNKLDKTSSAADWSWLFEQVYKTKSEYLDQEYLRKQGFVPSFTIKDDTPSSLAIKSTRFHQLTDKMLQLNTHIKVIHLVRDPRACINSWLSNPHEFPKDADPLLQWRSGQCRKNGVGEYWGFDDWKAVTKQALMLSKQYPAKFLLVHYDELKKMPVIGVKAIFDFCNIDFCLQTESFLNQSQSRHDSSKRSVFKKPDKTNMWTTQLDSTIAKSIYDEVVGTELDIFLHRC